MSEMTPELAKEMATEWKRMAGVDKSDIGPHFAANWIETARALVAKLPDPDIEEARKIAKPWLIYDDASTLTPDEPAMRAILAAIKRGRELATPATSA